MPEIRQALEGECRVLPGIRKARAERLGTYRLSGDGQNRAGDHPLGWHIGRRSINVALRRWLFRVAENLSDFESPWCWGCDWTNPPCPRNRLPPSCIQRGKILHVVVCDPLRPGAGGCVSASEIF